MQWIIVGAANPGTPFNFHLLPTRQMTWADKMTRWKMKQELNVTSRQGWLAIVIATAF
jgi:hypothetical protein